MKSNLLITLAATCLLLIPTGLGAQSQAQKYADKINSSEPFQSGVWGMLAVKANGDTLVNINSLRKMIPASNTKLITTGLALHNLGADFKFETKIGYTGTIKDGVLDGDVYIMGGGDPTIASNDTIATKIDVLFEQWRGFLQKAGITRINGRIIGDGRYFDGQMEPDSWEYGDLGTYYAPGGNGLSFFENEQDFTAKPGTRLGEPVSIKVKYPETPWMVFEHEAVTAGPGVGDNLYLYTNDLTTRASMRGTLGMESGTRTEECANKYGAFTCAYYFFNHLKAKGVTVTDGPADVDPFGNIRVDLASMEVDRQAAEWKEIKVLGSTFSPELYKIVDETNHRSDNFYAETCLRIVSRIKTGSADYEACREIEPVLLKELGVKNPSVGAHISDGSGLSRQNYISPDYFVRFLTAMMSSPIYETYVKTLPQPGQGTLKSRMQNSDPKVKARVYMKTGSMGGVRCYSGYILPSSGKKEDTIIFSLLTNNIMDNVYSNMDYLVNYLGKEN